MANGDIVRVSVLSVDENVTAVINTFHYRDDSGGSTAIDAATGASDWWTAFKTSLKPAASVDVTFLTVTYTCIGGPGMGNDGIYNVPLSDSSGGVNGPFHPSEIAISIKRNTGKTGRAQRGRIFWGPVPLDAFVDNEAGLVDQTWGPLGALKALVLATFTTQTVGLTPVLVNKAGVATATKLINTAVNLQCVHIVSRRARVVS